MTPNAGVEPLWRRDVVSGEVVRNLPDERAVLATAPVWCGHERPYCATVGECQIRRRTEEPMACTHAAWSADGSCCTCGAKGTAPWYRHAVPTLIQTIEAEGLLEDLAKMDADPELAAAMAAHAAAPIASVALLCGEGATDPTPEGPKPFGCGLPIDGGQREYRCADCDLAFHKACLSMHFKGSDVSGRPACSEAERLRTVVANVLAVCAPFPDSVETHRIENEILKVEVKLAALSSCKADPRDAVVDAVRAYRRHINHANWLDICRAIDALPTGGA